MMLLLKDRTGWDVLTNAWTASNHGGETRIDLLGEQEPIIVKMKFDRFLQGVGRALDMYDARQHCA